MKYQINLKKSIKNKKPNIPYIEVARICARKIINKKSKYYEHLKDYNQRAYKLEARGRG